MIVVRSRPGWWRDIHQHARHEHAWLLRSEALLFREIGERMGCTEVRAQQLVAEFGVQAKWATRRARFRWVKQ